jgi:PAS domain S-box-containing protein
MFKTGSPAPEADDFRARQIIDGLRDIFFSLDSRWRVTDCNSALEALVSRSRSDLLGRNFWELTGMSPESAFGQLSHRVLATHTPEVAEVLYTRQEPTRLLEVQVFPLADGIGTVCRDITQLRAAEQQLVESEARYRELADGTPAAAWMTRADGELEFVNQAMADALGRPREALLGEGWMASIDPADRARLMEERVRARSTHSAFRFEGRFRRPDGALRIAELYGRPRFNSAGAFCGHTGMAADVTEAKAFERRQKRLINELNHRVKNTLTTVQSLVHHTLRNANVPLGLQEILIERLLALSAAHDVLTRENWTGAPLGDIARETLKPYLSHGQIHIKGPDARVPPNAAVAVSMALHELAVNALKYGALSTTTGAVQLSWSRSDGALLLEWREEGGPTVRPPKRQGLGSRLLRRGLTDDLGAPAEMTYAPEGLVCRLRAPVLDDGDGEH